MITSLTNEATLLFTNKDAATAEHVVTLPKGLEVTFDLDAQPLHLYWPDVPKHGEFMPVTAIAPGATQSRNYLMLVDNLPPFMRYLSTHTAAFYRISGATSQQPHAFLVCRPEENTELRINPFATPRKVSYDGKEVEFVEVFECEDGGLHSHLMRVDAFPPGTFRRTA